MANPAQGKVVKATFAGGCFWCMESRFSYIKGVKEVISGFTGGQTSNPNYEQVGLGNSGHVEAIQVSYDPDQVSYEELLDAFWKEIDPTDAGGQFADRGSEYTTAIFYHNLHQRNAAMASKTAIEKSGVFNKPIVTKILNVSAFYPATEKHQDFYKKNPVYYKKYRIGSGREAFLKKTWAKTQELEEKKKKLEAKMYEKPSDKEIKKKLTPLQYKVTQENGTELPFNNEYVNNKKSGIYVDVVTGEPLFSSKDKFDSGSGWPSFTKALEQTNIVDKTDTSHGMHRVEVRSKNGDSHLGHVFQDGPGKDGQRYCINSAALDFIPVDELEKAGYGKYLDQFRQ